MQKVMCKVVQLSCRALVQELSSLDAITVDESEHAYGGKDTAFTGKIGIN